MKVWLIGENNPYQRDAEDGQRFAMYPEPADSAGGRLCHLILGMTERDYLRSFERRNLLHQPRWSAPAARAAAFKLATSEVGLGKVILLGARVWRAWLDASEAGEPGERWEPFREVMPNVLALPHPSGLSRAWNEPGSFRRAREAVAALAPHLAPLLGRAALPALRSPARSLADFEVLLAPPVGGMVVRAPRLDELDAGVEPGGDL